MRKKFPKWVILLCIAVVALAMGFSVFALLLNKKVPEPTPVVNDVQQNPERKVIGISVQGREIEAYTYLTPVPSPKERGETAIRSPSLSGRGPGGGTRLLFIGGIHGGYEWNSVLVAYDLMDYLQANPETIPANVEVAVIPNANPDGVYKITGKDGRFTLSDVPMAGDQSPGRFNAHNVDLNRNFDCNWAPTGTWKNKIVSGGTKAFSEPESVALRDYILANKPDAVVFYHSQAGAVYASQCGKGILPDTTKIMNAYAKASGYPAITTFDAYEVHGASEDWLAKIGIPAITVELATHKTVEWEKNLLGIQALLEFYK